MQLESKIEGLLFYKGEEVTVNSLAELLSATIPEIEEALEKLKESHKNRGLILVRSGNSVVLGIAPELSPLIESIRKEEITKDLSKAALETLSVILYKNGISRAEIDYIRGVNSSFILRNLLVRGLVAKAIDKNDSRKILYKPTIDALAHMGIASIEDLPNYAEVQKQLQEVMNNQETND